MNTIKLAPADKKRIKDDIILTFIFGALFVFALILLVTIGPLLYKLFGGEPEAGFMVRMLIISGLLSTPLIAISWRNILKYFDLLSGKKVQIVTSDFEIKRTRDDIFLVTKTPKKLKLSIYPQIADHINSSQTLLIQITRLSRMPLFISHDAINLIEKVEAEDDSTIEKRS